MFSSFDVAVQFSSVAVSRARLFATPWTAARPASLPGFTNSQSLLRLLMLMLALLLF